MVLQILQTLKATNKYTYFKSTFRFINQASISNIQFKVQPKHELNMMDKVMELINSFHNSKDAGKLSILSPKFFPLIPSRKNRPHLLSPTLFSFQPDGLLSLPQLFQVSLSCCLLLGRYWFAVGSLNHNAFETISNSKNLCKQAVIIIAYCLL